MTAKHVRGAGHAAIVAALAALVVGCGSPPPSSTATATATSSLSVTSSTTASPAPLATPTPSDLTADGRIPIRWFVGLGSGSAADMESSQPDFVRDLNASQTKVFLQMEMVPNSTAYDILQTEIAAGHAPDVVGPVGTRGRNGFAGRFLDLRPLVERHKFDLSAFEPELVNYFDENGTLVGLPYLIYPGFLWYNRDLFSKAGLPDLPTKVGQTYMGKPWDWSALADVAALLTLDSNGRNAADPAFDAKHVDQWGIDFQWIFELRRLGSMFGGGSSLAADGRTAQLPEAWAGAARWYYDAIWTRHIAPTRAQIDGKTLNEGITMSSGRIAMDGTWGWALNSVGWRAQDAKVKTWDIAVLPSWKGQTSSPLDADTFVIWKATRHPDEAFQVMAAIMADSRLQQRYGGMPAKIADRADYLSKWEAQLVTVFPTNRPISWSVLDEMVRHPAVPSHEADMPNFLKAIDVYTAFYTRLQTKSGLNMDAELAKLRSELQAAFDAAGTK